MPWLEALLRGQKVLARVDAAGAFVVDGGRVEIRYRPTDARAYRASLSNLERPAGGRVLPDEACVAAEPAPEAGADGAAKSVKSVKSVKAASRGGSSGRMTKAAAIAAGPPKPMAGEWVAYTDGACSGNPGPAGSGVVVVLPSGAMVEGFDYLGTSTNNVAELTAILRALEAIPDEAPAVAIHTDSQYAIGVLTKGWKAKANQELVAGVKRALAKRERVRLVYVPGHAGVPLNERADELAREAIRARRTKPAVIAVAGDVATKLM